MKKIILVIFTFSGIYPLFAQNDSGNTDFPNVKVAEKIITPLVKPNTIFSKEQISVHLFPNPAKNKVDIEITGFETGNILVQLLDNKGTIVRNDKRFVYGGYETIVFMFSQKPGVYFLLLKQNQKTVKSRLLIQ
jgi:hypothetical protein